MNLVGWAGSATAEKGLHAAQPTFGAFFFLSILIWPMAPKNWATSASVTFLGRPLQEAEEQSGPQVRRCSTQE